MTHQYCIRHFIALARKKRPTVPPAVSNYVVESYVRLRKLSKDEEEQKKLHTHTSARTLLGVLRLAQALARLRFAETVEHPDVDEALRLMECSKESLVEEEDRDRDHDRSVVSQIYRLIKDMATSRQNKRAKRRKPRRMGKGPNGERDMDIDEEFDDSSDDDDSGELSLIDIRARVLSKGFTEAQFMDTIVQVCVPVAQRLAYVDTHALNSTRIWMYGFAPPMAQNCVS